MDIKVEFDRSLCHGCLSSDRKLVSVVGSDCVLFHKLRGDFQPIKNELPLCWECVGVLRKIKQYQTKIKSAHFMLLQYQQTVNQNHIIPNTLSCFGGTHQKPDYYNYEFVYDDSKPDTLIFDDFIEKATSVTILNDIKIEVEDNRESSIKPEYFNNDHFTNNDLDFTNNDIDFNTDIKAEIYIHNNLHDLKSESDKDIPLSEYLKQPKKKKPKKTKNKNKLPLWTYENYVTVTERPELTEKITEKYYDIVHLSYEEYEGFLTRFRKKIGHKAMQFKCNECGLGYHRWFDMLRHKAIIHDKKPYPHPCTVCKVSIPSQAELAQHWKECHTKMYKCVHCSELCVCKQQVTKHRRWAHTKIYTCNTCNMQFGVMRTFTDHYAKVHDRVFCDYCSKSYFATNKRLLANHIKRQHLPGYCKICDRPYKSQAAFEYHASIYHPEIVKKIVKKDLCYCVECDLQFPTIYRYKRHIATSVKHTPRKKIRVPCSACEKTFAKKSTMNSHFRLVHSHESKFHCEPCNKYFARGFGLRTHIAQVHEKRRLPKDKICDLCGRGFATLRILENHRRTHTGERPFKCAYCPAAFAQKYAMSIHQKKQHENVLSIEYAIK